MKIFDAKKRLAILWFIFTAGLFIIILMQSLLGKFEDKSNEAWSWFFPNVLPTLSLMISVFILDLKSRKSRKTIDKFYFRIPFWLSILYLTTILITILVQPFSNKSIIDLMQESSLYLGPFQGLVTGSIGFLFVKGEG